MSVTTAIPSRTWLRIGCLFALVPLAVSFAQAPPPVTLANSPILVVDKDNKATVTLRMRNTSGGPLTLHLFLTDFESVTTKQHLGTAANFTAADAASGPYLAATPTAMPADKTAVAKLDVTNLWEAGESHATLQQDGVDIADLTAVKYKVPFAVKLATPATDKEDAIVYPGTSASISLKNDDSPMTYRVKWILTVGGRPIPGPDQNIPPGSVSFPIILPQDVFSWAASGFIQDDLEPAKLQLRMAGGAAAQEGLPAAEIPVKLRMRSFATPAQQVWNAFWILVVLTGGALISIALNIGIPNQMKRNDVLKALRDVTRRINSLDSNVGGAVITFMRVERARLGERLQNLNWFSPNLAAELPLVQQAVDLLNARLDVADQVSKGLAAERAALVPPIQLDRLNKAAKAILDTATRPDLSASDLPSLIASVVPFQQQIAALGQTDADFEAQLGKAEGTLKTRIDAARGSPLKATSEWAPFLPELAPLFDKISQAPAAVQPPDYFERDIASQYGQICADYLDARALVGDSARVKQLDTAVADKLKKLFQQHTYVALAKGRVLLNTAEQGVLEQDLINALTANPPKARVLAVPSRPNAFDAAWFEAHFADSNLDNVAARELITCEWVFGNFRQQGWRVSHYFTKPGAEDVHVEFRDADQNPIKTANGIVQLRVPVIVRKRVRAGHIGLALLRTGLALFVALIVLIASAQDKIASLTLVPAVLAILVIGLTADTIKNLLAK